MTSRGFKASVAALALLGCQSTPVEAPNTAGASASTAQATPSSAATDDGTIGPDMKRCRELIAAIGRAANDASACKSDEECKIVIVDLCDVKAVGCNWAAISSRGNEAALRAAVKKLNDSACPTAECDCPTPPKQSVCVDGHCRDKRGK
jgi:hypothetical protein